MAESAPNFRQTEVDYANFPADASYISRADVAGAYNQGKQDIAQELEATIADKDAEIAQLRARIDHLQDHDKQLAWDNFLRTGL